MLEFLGLPGVGRLLEADLERGLLDNLQAFLLELGRGFAFVGRQYRISSESKDFYVDLVFYNFLLKCFVLFDLKSGELTHQDIGQIDMYPARWADLLVDRQHGFESFRNRRVASGKAWRKSTAHVEKAAPGRGCRHRDVMASTLTGNEVGDPSQVAPLLDQIEATIASVTADGAYDGMPTCDVVAGYGEDICVIIPPHVTAVPSAGAVHNPSQRDKHILSIAARGRLGWQEETNYGQRALVETAMGRYKAIIGHCLRARSFSGQKAEAAVGVAVLTRMLDAGRPDSVRRLNIAA